MDLNALMQGAMQDPAARDFITQMLQQPNPRVQALAQMIQPPKPPQFANMQFKRPGDAATSSFDGARSLMDELLGDYDPAGQGVLPPEQGPPMPPGMAAPGAAPPPAAPGGMPTSPVAPQGPIQQSTLGPMDIGGINLSLLDEMLAGLGGLHGGGR